MQYARLCLLLRQTQLLAWAQQSSLPEDADLCPGLQTAGSPQLRADQEQEFFPSSGLPGDPLGGSTEIQDLAQRGHCVVTQ